MRFKMTDGCACVLCRPSELGRSTYRQIVPDGCKSAPSSPAAIVAVSPEEIRNRPCRAGSARDLLYGRACESSQMQPGRLKNEEDDVLRVRRCRYRCPGPGWCAEPVAQPRA